MGQESRAKYPWDENNAHEMLDKSFKYPMLSPSHLPPDPFNKYSINYRRKVSYSRKLLTYQISLYRDIREKLKTLSGRENPTIACAII